MKGVPASFKIGAGFSKAVVLRVHDGNPGSCSSGVEHFLGKEEVTGSNPVKSSRVQKRTDKNQNKINISDKHRDC